MCVWDREGKRERKREREREKEGEKEREREKVREKERVRIHRFFERIIAVCNDSVNTKRIVG